MPSRRVALEPLLEQLHDAALGALLWEVVLASLTELFQASSAVIIFERPQGGNWGISAGGDARTHSAYFEHHAGIHPLAPRCLTAPAGSVLTDRMLMPRAEFERTEFYADWARPNRFEEFLNLRLNCSDQAVAAMGLTRSSRAGEFGADDFALARRLAPHVRRAVATYQRLAEALLSRQAMAEALDRVRRGVFGLDAAGRIVFANRAARSLLAAGDALRAEGNLLAAARPDRTAALRRTAGRQPGARRPGLWFYPGQMEGCPCCWKSRRWAARWRRWTHANRPRYSCSPTTQRTSASRPQRCCVTSTN